MTRASHRRTSRRRALAGLAAGIVVVCGPATLAAQKRFTDWSTVQDPQYGFLIAYPGNVFAPKAGAPNRGGQVFVSRDGNAQLLVGTFENEGGATIEEYRQQILSDNYAGAELDFAPVKNKWFIVSGTRGTLHFYERVSFTCGGKLINSWALLYPAAEKRFYDQVVEAIAPTYSPGAGPKGDCN